jgi:hypothetical protein
LVKVVSISSTYILSLRLAQLSAILPESGASLQRFTGEGSLLRSRGPPYLVANAHAAPEVGILIHGGIFRGKPKAENCTAQLESDERRYSLLCVLLARQEVTVAPMRQYAECPAHDQKRSNCLR